MKKDISVHMLLAAGLLLNCTVCFAGKAEIKTVKQYAIARCNSVDTTVGFLSGKPVALNVQELVDQVYDQAAAKLGAVGFKVADPEAVNKAAAAANEKAAKKEAMMKKMQEMQKAQAASMPAGMPAGMPDMSSMEEMKKLMAMQKPAEAKGKEASEENEGGFNNVKREAAKSSGLAELYPDSNNLSRCAYCKPSMPKTHKAFWGKKFAANVVRDKRKRAELKKLGIKSVVFWECQIKKNAPKLVARLSKVLSSRKKISAQSVA